MKSILLFLLLCSFTISAQDGVLDPSFGNSGATILPYYEEDAQILSIIKVGNFLFAGGYTRENKVDFSIIKMDLDGDLVSNFGENGLLRFELTSGWGNCSKIIEHPDGDILAMGWDRNINSDEYVLIKMDTNGNLDSNFGDNGVSMGAWDSSSFSESEIADAVILSDGRLIAVGRSYNGQNTDFVVACYDASGNPCSDFGTNGIITEEFKSSNSWEVATAIARDSEDNIYVGGDFRDDPVDTYPVLKYDNSGNQISSFGTSGVLDFGNATSDTRSLGDISIDGEDRLIITGSINNGSTHGYVARYDLDGNLDSSFGDGGEVIIPTITSLSLKDAKIIDNNSILVAGNTSGFGTKQVIAKIDNSGQLISSFGNNGITSVTLESTFNGISEIAVDSECIYAGGYAHNGDYFKFAVSKFTNLLLSTEDVNNDLAKISLFPNPTSLELNIEAEDGFQSLRIYDISGKNVFNTNMNELVFKHQVSVNHLDSGLYHVVLDGKSNSSVIKFYKK